MAPHALINQQAPTISLPDSTGETFTFTPGSNGQPTAVIFWPKSGSYGCTQQVCQFRDALAEKDVFKKSQITVIGISPDSVDEQKLFKEKQKLSFPVLSDVSGEARKAYSVPRGMLGMSDSSRVTFVIDAKGVVRDSLDSTLNFGAHSKFVQKWLDKLDAESDGKTEGIVVQA